MQPSMFNVQVPVPGRDEVFLMNTFTDAQLLVSSDVASLLSRAAVYVLQPLSDAELGQLFTRAEQEAFAGVTFSDDARKLLIGLPPSVCCSKRSSGRSVSIRRSGCGTSATSPTCSDARQTITAGGRGSRRWPKRSVATTSGIPGTGATGGRTHYAFDTFGPEGAMRVIVIDNSAGSLEASDPQRAAVVKRKVLERYPEKALNDTHTPQVLKAQVLMAGLSTALLPLLPFSPRARRSALVTAIGFAVSCLPTLRFAATQDQRLVPAVPLFSLVRAFGLGLGLVRGLLRS